MILNGLYVASKNDVKLRQIMRGFYSNMFGVPVPRDIKKVIIQITKGLNGETTERKPLDTNCYITSKATNNKPISVNDGIEFVKLSSKLYFKFWYEHNPEYFV